MADKNKLQAGDSNQTMESCSEYDGRALPLAEALDRVLNEVSPISDRELLPIRQALGRVLAADVRSENDVPAHTNSAMDGYALAADDLSNDGQTSLSVIGTALAGRPFDGQASRGDCVRIMTGATIPDGTDTVVMQERVTRDDDTATIDGSHVKGENVRYAGEDIEAGSIALTTGTLLDPAHIGLLASVGVAETEVLRKPRVAFFSTGDELREVGQKLEAGQIHDSNRYTLFGMLERLGVEINDLGVVPDRNQDLERAFRLASESADVIITSGGVSVGEADYVMGVFEQFGQIDFWSVAIKPGRPTVFGKMGNALFFGLPGNPVSVMATFYQIVQPALRKLSGIRKQDCSVRISATCLSKIKK